MQRLLAGPNFALCKHFIERGFGEWSAADYDRIYFSGIANIVERIRVEQHQIGKLAGINRPQLRFAAH
jgi:hypothetical protein